MAGGVAAVVYSDSDGEAPTAAPVRQSRRMSVPGDGGGGRSRPGSGVGPHDAMLAGGVLAVRLCFKTCFCGCCCLHRILPGPKLPRSGQRLIYMFRQPLLSVCACAVAVVRWPACAQHLGMSLDALHKMTPA